MTSDVTRWVAHQGVYAVFVLMAVDCLLPLGGELTMLYAGVVAAGAVAAAIWCFGFAAGGWALGSAWTNLHHAFAYVDALAAPVVVSLLIVAGRRRLRT